MDRTRPVGKRSPPLDDREVAPGATIGAWRIVRILSSGGFGAVYEVEHAHNARRAALKLMHAHLVCSDEMLARFDREIQVISRLHHPNIVQLVDAGFNDAGRPYLCMELLDGEELWETIARSHGLSPHTTAAILDPLCDAVATAHELGIIHRDIKASNIVICRAPDAGLGRVVLLDFGIAKLSDALAPELTATHQTLGTPTCMAPEQIQGQRADARTDVYALGVLLFHMLTGDTPFRDPSPTMSQYLHLHARRPRASTVCDVSPRIDEVIARAMAIAPADRFPDARSLFAAARVALADTTLSLQVIHGQADAILVQVGAPGGTDLEEPLLDDLESVLPTAERFLGPHGFALALDLGASAVFVSRPRSGVDAVGAALALATHLDAREHRDPRVHVGIAVHRDEAAFVSDQVQSPSLLRPASWKLPDPIVGVWVSDAVDETGAKRIR